MEQLSCPNCNYVLWWGDIAAIRILGRLTSRLRPALSLGHSPLVAKSTFASGDPNEPNPKTYENDKLRDDGRVYVEGRLRTREFEAKNNGGKRVCG